MPEKESLTTSPSYKDISTSTAPTISTSSTVPTQPTAPGAPMVATAPSAFVEGHFTCPPQTQQPKGYPVQSIPFQHNGTQDCYQCCCKLLCSFDDCEDCCKCCYECFCELFCWLDAIEDCRESCCELFCGLIFCCLGND